MSRKTTVDFCQLAERDQFIIVNVRPILFGKQILIDPERPSPCKNYGTVLILPKALLVDATTEVVSLSKRNLQDAEQSSSSVMCTFRAALANHAVLNVLMLFSAGSAIIYIVALGETVHAPSKCRSRILKDELHTRCMFIIIDAFSLYVHNYERRGPRAVFIHSG